MAIYNYPYLDRSVSGGSGAFSYITLTGFVYESATNAITATASGTQTTSVLLTTSINRVTTITTGGDSVLLPPSVPGLSIKVINATASTSMNVYPASATQGGVTGGDSINALSQNTAYAIAGTKVVSFSCAVAGIWNTTLTA